jgi:hypothetical protein
LRNINDASLQRELRLQAELLYTGQIIAGNAAQSQV